MGAAKKSMRAGGILYAIICLLSVVTCVLYAMNATRAYYGDLDAIIVSLLVGAIGATGVVFALVRGERSNAMDIVSDVLRVAVPCLIAVAGVMFISVRVESLAKVLGSNLELGNAEAYGAATQSVAVIVVSLVAWLVSVIAAFVGGRRPVK